MTEMGFYKVIIVDDEPIIREGLRKHVNWEALGLEVAATSDSAEAALCCAEQNPPDILVTDICMRGKDGLNLVEDLLERGIAPQVILISSYNDFSYAQRAVRLSVVREYILKPVDIDQLSALLKEIKKELDQRKSSANASPLLPESVTVSAYRTFLRDIRMKGYDRYQLAQYIKSGDSQKAMDIWEDAEEIMTSSSTAFPVLKRFCSSFLVSLISDGILDEEDCAQNDPLKLLESCGSREDMISCISGLIRQKSEAICQRSHSVRSKLIEISLQIIEREYCNPDFNLTVLAAELNVAPNYLSSRFKDEMGVGFMKYRLEKQMEKAKLLLSNPVYKIYSISSMVGFLDEKYFSKQFKRYTGDTPKDYRNNRTS